MSPIKSQIRFNTDIDNNFVHEIKAMPGCENIEHCIQCGTCSGTCPLSIYMDYTPRRIIYLTRSGFKKDVLSSLTLWLCASCYSCTVECPKKIKVTDVMYALKRRAIDEGLYARNATIPTLAQIFFKMVQKRGRISEGRLALKLFLKTGIRKIFSMMDVGLKLMRTGRFSTKSESIQIQERKELRKMLEGV